MNWNGRSVRNKTLELSNFIQSHEVDIAILTETWLQPNASFFIPKFSCIRMDRSNSVADRGGGVAILIRNGIDYNMLNCLKTKIIESVGVRLHSTIGSIDIIAAYFAGSRSKDELLKFKHDIKTLTRRSEAFVVVGDFNARHRMWHCSRANTAGNTLAGLIQSSNFYVHAPQSPTYIPSGTGRPSVLDLVLSNNLVNMSVPIVHHDLSSDHLPTIFELNTGSSVVVRNTQVRCYQRADWSRFKNVINS